MPKLAMLNMEGDQVGEIDLSDSVFGIKPNKFVLHELVVNYLANKRQGTQSAKTRAEVAGGGRKPWRQKGTGRARQGSTRAPQWRHGGVVFAPKPRNYGYTVNKKARRLAMKSAFSSKVLDNNMIILDKIDVNEYSTRKIVNMLKNINVEKKALIVLPEYNDKIVKSVNNIPEVKTSSVNILNVYDLLNAEKLVVVRDAVNIIEEVYA
ncbi:MAG: 50S ribosomal protein L4 [Oscillospiraceae bacterium]|nr:50S ribosomal protein L4 [Oscillospiraceae bacterium]